MSLLWREYKWLVSNDVFNESNWVQSIMSEPFGFKHAVINTNLHNVHLSCFTRSIYSLKVEGSNTPALLITDMVYKLEWDTNFLSQKIQKSTDMRKQEN